MFCCESVLECHLQCLQCFYLTDPRGIGLLLWVLPLKCVYSCDQSTCHCDVYPVQYVVVIMISSPLPLCHGSLIHHLLTELLQ